jgi:DNA ligase-1
MHYSSLVKVYEALEATSKRLEKTHILSEFLKEIPEKGAFANNSAPSRQSFPPWDKRTLGLLEQAWQSKSVAAAAGVTEREVNTAWKDAGDLGKVAVELVGKKKQATLVSQDLEVKEVFETLQKLPAMEGSGSTDRKIKTIASLLHNASGNESLFLLRTVLETLRVGVADGTLRDAIAWAFLETKSGYDAEKNDITLDDTSREAYNAVVEQVQRAYDRCNDFAQVAVAAKTEGLAGLEAIHLELGTPIRVMLAQREPDVASGMERVGTPAALEMKYDGFRMQVHKQGDTVTLFTRRLENVTTQFPDVVAAVKEGVSAREVLLDCEAVGYDLATKKYRPFQEISQRIRRKYEIETIQKKLPVELVVFDILYLEGEELLEQPFEERRALLERTVKNIPQSIVPSNYLKSADPVEGERFYKEAVASGNEGIMCKAFSGKYNPGSRVGHMVKVKPVLETMDLVVVAAEWGEGKRSGWLTSFTVACRDDDGDFVTIGKVGTGLKELEQEGGVTFNHVTELLKPYIVAESGRDVEVQPVIVFELAFEEIQKSPSYESGYALRFPRVIRVRDDRGPDDITELEEVRVAFEHQRGR